MSDEEKKKGNCSFSFKRRGGGRGGRVQVKKKVLFSKIKSKFENNCSFSFKRRGGGRGGRVQLKKKFYLVKLSQNLRIFCYEHWFKIL